MKPFLMYKDQDFDPKQQRPPNEHALAQDLSLPILFEAMTNGDEYLLDIARKSILPSLTDTESILYRQNIIKDCLNNPGISRNVYDLTVETIEKKKDFWWGFTSRYPSSILHSALNALKMFVGQLKKLRIIADEHAAEFDSEGFVRFFSMLQEELSDEYFACIDEHLRELKFRRGVLISAGVGKGNKPANFVLHKARDKKLSLVDRILGKQPSAYSFRLDPRDENGAKAFSDLRDRGVNVVANALAQSADHILRFFQMLRTELAFYVGCLNLHEQLVQKEKSTCFPVPVISGQRSLTFRGVYDVCLALSMPRNVVGNDLNADRKDLVIITGANQGGKSTLLRSIGLAQLMMQAGMFVPAESFSSEVCESIFTHYKREEDISMKSGKLDEELKRMSGIADNISPNSMLLFNESFSATNEREGSEIASQITKALIEEGVKVLFVTHLYQFAHDLYFKKMKNAIFLRAERMPDGTRTFRLIEGEPLQTSFGADLYEKLFSAKDRSGAEFVAERDKLRIREHDSRPAIND
jgi:hypothetical protein